MFGEMKIHSPYLAMLLLIVLGRGIQSVQASPNASRAKSNPPLRFAKHAKSELSPVEIERLRKKAAQNRARVREERKKTAAAQQAAKDQLAAIFAPSNLQTQDWKELLRSVVASRKTIVPVLEKLPLTMIEQGNAPMTNRWLDEMYKAIVSRMTPISNQDRVPSRLEDQATLQLIEAQSVAIGHTLILFKDELGRRGALLPEVNGSLAAIQSTTQQVQILLLRTMDKPAANRGIRQL